MSSTQPSTALYEIRNTQGTGKGMFARNEIKAGDLILVEKPLLDVKRQNGETLQDFDRRMGTTVDALPPSKVQEFYSLHNNKRSGEGSNRLGIINTNAFGEIYHDWSLYTIASRINHSCRPNAMPSWRDGNIIKIHAMEPISAGEEITIAYKRDPELLDSAEDRHRLHFPDFQCGCRVCRLPPARLAESDQNRLQLRSLKLRILDSESWALDRLQACHAYLLLVRQEFGHQSTFCSLAYERAYDICCRNSDEARATVLAERAFSILAGGYGPDSDPAVNMGRFAMDVKSDREFGQDGVAWKTVKEGNIPRHLAENLMEEWVFRLPGWQTLWIPHSLESVQ